MKRILLILLILTSFNLKSQSQKLSLSECIDLAIENNENLKNSILEEKISKALSNEYLSIGFPQINFDGGIKYNHEVPKSLLDISRFMPGVPEGTEQEVQFGQAYDGRVDLFVNQMIFNGSYFVGLSAAKELVKLSEKMTERNVIDIHESVSKAYYTTLNTKSRVDLVDSNIDRLDALLKQTKSLYENGFVEKLDLDRIQVSFNNLKSEKIKADRLYDLSLAVLKFQIGISVDKKIELIEEFNEELVTAFTFDLNEFDYSKRIEYSILQTDKNLKFYELKNNRSQYLPQVYANYNYGYNTSASQSNIFFESDRWKKFGTFGLQVIVPIFDGFLKRSRINQSKFKIEQVENQMLFLERSINLQINQSLAAYQNSKESLKIASENLVLAQDVYFASEKKYAQGVGSNLELIDSNNSLKIAQNQYYNSLYESIISIIDIKKTLGILMN
ncbi:MAG: TolC family protein [Bacteroidota bacterium]|jgi:outer membrane protein TolC|nr:TolC family protein [Bacteroidota bacterium]|tara:strand:+ start:201 stop:1535 length:1335 start_codon:yes stop_codon:yes gene_type:complete